MTHTDKLFMIHTALFHETFGIVDFNFTTTLTKKVTDCSFKYQTRLFPVKRSMNI